MNNKIHENKYCYNFNNIFLFYFNFWVEFLPDLFTGEIKSSTERVTKLSILSNSFCSWEITVIGLFPIIFFLPIEENSWSTFALSNVSFEIAFWYKDPSLFLDTYSLSFRLLTNWISASIVFISIDAPYNPLASTSSYPQSCALAAASAKSCGSRL